ncbi:MAG: CoA ester lyase [bacterium]|nr:CoA ester lyase [bacterium]
MFDPKVLRSVLFVPATNEKLLESAVRRNADAVQLDLEDAILGPEKEAARKAANGAIGWLEGRSPYVVVRINAPIRMAVRDLEAVVIPGLHAITVPKVPNAPFLTLLDETIGELEAERGLEAGSVGLIAQIETPGGLAHINEIAASTPRLKALTIGPEDLAVSLGAQTTLDAMYVPNVLALTAARCAGIIPLGYIGSITLYDDQQTYREWIVRAAALGFEGAFCIHPNQVAICNEVFQPSGDEVEAARRLMEAFANQAAQGVGVFSFEGRMVDAPIVDRARAILARAEVIRGR